MVSKWEKEIKDPSIYRQQVDVFCKQVRDSVNSTSPWEVYTACKDFFSSKAENKKWLDTFSTKKIDFMNEHAIPLCKGDENCLEEQNSRFIQSFLKEELKKSLKNILKDRNVEISDFIKRDVDELIEWRPGSAFQIMKFSTQVSSPLGRKIQLLEKLEEIDEINTIWLDCEHFALEHYEGGEEQDKVIGVCLRHFKRYGKLPSEEDVDLITNLESIPHRLQAYYSSSRDGRWVDEELAYYGTGEIFIEDPMKFNQYIINMVNSIIDCSDLKKFEKLTTGIEKDLERLKSETYEQERVFLLKLKEKMGRYLVYKLLSE